MNIDEAIAFLRAEMEKYREVNHEGSSFNQSIRDKLFAGYCLDCMYPDPKGTCQCWNDE
jgi:hypothetical protein